MNNTIEYETLILGLQRVNNFNVGILKVVGDLEIFVRQVHDIIHCVSPHLKGYEQELWHLIFFSKISISFLFEGCVSQL